MSRTSPAGIRATGAPGLSPAQPAVLGGAPSQAAGPVAVVVLHHDLPQGLDPGAGQVIRLMLSEVFQQPGGVAVCGKDRGLGAGGVLARADRAAVAAPLLLVDQAGR
ncbi:hypothetical protein [Streptomyces sp. NPDC058572]|uniref:hypothetical protein n=1 Tax=Streptomyces sp. NPDC058572 TaxID=3346546 RepID=UPI00365FB78E